MIGSPLQSSSPREKEKKGENSHKACMGTFSCGRSPRIYRHLEWGFFIKILIIMSISTNIHKPYVCDPLRCSFRGFFYIWFSIIHSKSIFYPKITNYILINSIFSLVSKYIIFVIIWLCLISDFIEHLLLVKVNALTLTFDFSLSNLRIKFLKLLI